MNREKIEIVSGTCTLYLIIVLKHCASASNSMTIVMQDE